MKELESFDDRVWKTDFHWWWLGPTSLRGRVSGARWAYKEHKGEIPKGHDVVHACGEDACVNPDHLKLSERKEVA